MECSARKVRSLRNNFSYTVLIELRKGTRPLPFCWVLYSFRNGYGFSEQDKYRMQIFLTKERATALFPYGQLSRKMRTRRSFWIPTTNWLNSVAVSEDNASEKNPQDADVVVEAPDFMAVYEDLPNLNGRKN